MFRYIVIEGPIGVGKTSLAKLLAKEFNARCILENVGDNPFLPHFYEGTQGLVTDAIAAWASEAGWDDLAFFGCGPDLMMSALAMLATIHGVASCQVSLENYMGCAIGVCLSCAAKIRAQGAKGWVHQFVCQDGPVFEAGDVIFENKWEGCKR